MTLVLKPSHVDHIHTHARQTYPEECCGVIVGRDVDNRRVVDHFVSLPNVAPVDQRPKRFEIDPLSLMKIERLLEGSGLSVVGFYHSHPDHPAEPSETDLREAWPVYSYVIQSVRSFEFGALQCWILDETSIKFASQSLIVQDEPAEAPLTKGRIWTLNNYER